MEASVRSLPTKTYWPSGEIYEAVYFKNPSWLAVGAFVVLFTADII